MSSYSAQAAIVFAAILSGGCASHGDPRDPFEPANRAVHAFNEAVDKVALTPIAKGYQKIVPSPVRHGVRNVYSNLDDVVVLSANVMQLKPREATSDLLRISINTLLGFGGLLDIASEMGLRKHNEDFGQTLGYWGLGSGPYIVLPFLGPSNLRDAAGLVADSHYLDPVYRIENETARYGNISLRLIGQRADLLGATSAMSEAALDPYEYSRDFYLERRDALVRDGRPLPEDE